MATTTKTSSTQSLKRIILHKFEHFIHNKSIFLSHINSQYDKNDMKKGFFFSSKKRTIFFDGDKTQDIFMFPFRAICPFIHLFVCRFYFNSCLRLNSWNSVNSFLLFKEKQKYRKHFIFCLFFCRASQRLAFCYKIHTIHISSSMSYPSFATQAKGEQNLINNISFDAICYLLYCHIEH